MFFYTLYTPRLFSESIEERDKWHRTQVIFACLKSATEQLEGWVKYIQS